MLRKYLVMAFIGCLLSLFFASTSFARKNEETKRAERAEKVKAGITALGIGPNAKVEIKLYDKTKIKGYVKESTAEQFVVVDGKTGVETTVTYPEVKQVKGSNNLNGKKIAIGVGIVVGLIVLAIIIGRS